MPLYIIIPNKGPPAFKSKFPNIKMSVNTLQTLMFSSMIDPDLEDTPSLELLDFGTATHFI